MSPAQNLARVTFMALFWVAAIAGVNPAHAVDNASPGLNESDTPSTTRLRVAKGFQVERLYAVPIEKHGSWINLCIDNRGRILVSDQYGGLYRFARPAAGAPLDGKTIEEVPAPIRAVNGMVWAFDALYVTVNDYENKLASGLYRVSDSDGDDKLDRVELLRAVEGRGDHAAHAVVPTTDGQGLYLVTGNAVKRMPVSRSRVPTCWGEDHLLPSMPDPRFRQRDVLAPAGTIYRVSPDGRQLEIVATGFRNVFDAAVNRDGELFTFDSDDEGDFNLPWYRPTRVCHVVSGGEFGWRNGAGKWPPWYPDNLPPVIDIGPGSPTGMTFGYGARFPARYQESLFVLDWSWGKMYAVHLKPEGASYGGEKEEFLSGAPLPLTDAIIHPSDGAMYITTGGRKIESALYRITYIGSEATSPATWSAARNPRRALRQSLEEFHGRHDSRAVTMAWPLLDDPDRFIRWAARTALEHQPVGQWTERTIIEPEPNKQAVALLALARASGIDPEHRREIDGSVDTVMGSRLLKAMEQIDWDRLNWQGRVTALRAIQIALVRFGRPDGAHIQRLVAKLDPLFPSSSPELNWLLCETLVYLQSPTVAAKGVSSLGLAVTQEEQIECARSLRLLTTGWTADTRTAYFRWLLKAAGTMRGGASFDKFIEFIRNDAVGTLSDAEKIELNTILAEKPVRASALDGLATTFSGRVPREWSLDELTQLSEGTTRAADLANGRRIFAAAACFACHRMGNEGGMSGPDLTSAGRRYSPRDLLDQILNPSKEVNEQYVTSRFATKDGETIDGVVVNLKGDTLEVNTDLTDPSRRVTLDRKNLTSITASKVSPMPNGLLALLTENEILDLLAYLRSGAIPNSPAFAP